MDLIRSAEDAAALIRAHERAPVWAYLRVSSAKQANDGDGLEVQHQAVMEVATRLGLGQPVIFAEVGSASKPMLSVPISHMDAAAAVADGGDEDSRRHLMLLLQHLGRRGHNDLIVYRLDRISRLAYEQELLMEMLRRRKVRLHSSVNGETESIASTDPARVLLRQIMASFAQYERAMIKARMDAGLRLKAARGSWASGRPPRGYLMRDHDLAITPNEDERADVVEVFVCAAAGMGLRQIARHLTDHGRAKHWAPWSHVTISRMLRQKSIYMGILPDRYGSGTHSRPDLAFPGLTP